MDWKKNAGKEVTEWVAKKFHSSTQTSRVTIKAPPHIIENCSPEGFEKVLENIRTGLEVLSLEKLKINIDLGPYGTASGMHNCLILLATTDHKKKNQHRDPLEGTELCVSENEVGI